MRSLEVGCNFTAADAQLVSLVGFGNKIGPWLIRLEEAIIEEADKGFASAKVNFGKVTSSERFSLIHAAMLYLRQRGFDVNANNAFYDVGDPDPQNTIVTLGWCGKPLSNFVTFA